MKLEKVIATLSENPYDVMLSIDGKVLPYKEINISWKIIDNQYTQVIVKTLRCVDDDIVFIEDEDKWITEEYIADPFILTDCNN